METPRTEAQFNKRVKNSTRASMLFFQGTAPLKPLGQSETNNLADNKTAAQNNLSIENSKFVQAYTLDADALEQSAQNKNNDWELDNQWYDQEEGEVNRKENLGFQANEKELEDMEESLAAKNKAQSLSQLRKQERFLEQNKWEVQKMLDSGVFQLADHSYETEIDSKRVVLKVQDIKPAFLKEKRVEAKLSTSISPLKDPNSDFAVVCKQGSAILKSIRERNERMKQQSSKIFEISGSRLANVLKLNADTNAAPLSEDVEQVDYKKSCQYAGVFSSIQDEKKQDGTQHKNMAQSDFSKGKSLKQQREYLPIFSVREELMKIINDNKIIVIVGETGSGKTTQLTQYLLEEGYAERGTIGCTQPRRVAAVSVAARVAEEIGNKLGDTVGYAIRFEVCSTNNTKIKYMTDGVLLRESLNDQMLEQYSAIIMDEAHERSLHTDVLFGILKKVAAARRDLKIIVTSATMNSDKFSRFFNNAPVYTIPGRTYPVEIRYSDQVIEDYVDAAIKKAIEIHIKEPPGDILVFMTGQEDVEATCQILAERLLKIDNVPAMLILPIYSQLPSEAQARIFMPTEQRKCIVATNIAETSLTLDSVRYVIDTGLCKLKVYNPRIGMDGLQVTLISQANADQRAGRAGRTGPGKCFRLYKATAYRNEFFPNNIPEIQRTNLANVVLLLKSLNVDDLLEFDFMDPPPQETILNAMYQLWILGALNKYGALTDLGKKMAEFPLDPPLSKILIVAEEIGCSKEALAVVSMLSVPAIFYRPKDREQEADLQRQKLMIPESDHLTLYNVYKLWKESKYSHDWCKEHFIHPKSMQKVREVRKQLKDIMRQLNMRIISCNNSLDLLRKAICAGYFINAARVKSIGEYFNMRTGLPCKVHPSSVLFCLGYVPDYVVYHEVIMTSREYIHTVTAVDPAWLAELGPMFFVMKESVGDQKMKVKYFDGANEWDGSNIDALDKNESKFETETAYFRYGKKDSNNSVVHFGSRKEANTPWRMPRPPKKY